MTLPPLVEAGPPLTPAELDRFSRHVLLPQLGAWGQRRLRAARIAVVGAGGLGSPALLYLAAAGVGTLGVIDSDEVELTNLQRQVLHTSADVGRAKVDSARDRLAQIDPALDVRVHHVRLDEANIGPILSGYDLVVDGTDNFPTRYLVNNACARLGLPLVWGSVFQFSAQVSVFWATPPERFLAAGATGVELRDLFAAAPEDGTVPSCSDAGVLGALCGQVGSLMATEAVKLVTGIGELLLGRVLVLDALAARWTVLPLRPAGTERSGASVDPVVASPEPVRSVVMPPTPTPASGLITARELASRLAARERGEDAFVLVDVREPTEHAACDIDGSVLIPLAELFSAAGRAKLDPATPVIVFCHVGNRSAQAAALLKASGFASVSDLAGGVLAWNVS